MSDIDPTLRPAWCSFQSTDEPPAGTAAHEQSWVLLEVPGRWGRDIFDGEALGADLSQRLEQHVAACGSRMLFIRRPGREGQQLDRHRFYLCDTRPGRRSIRTGRVDGPADMLGLDLTPGAHVAGTREVAAPVPLVCTHPASATRRGRRCRHRDAGSPARAGRAARTGRARAPTRSRVRGTSSPGPTRPVPVGTVRAG